MVKRTGCSPRASIALFITAILGHHQNMVTKECNYRLPYLATSVISKSSGSSDKEMPI